VPVLFDDAAADDQPGGRLVFISHPAPAAGFAPLGRVQLSFYSTPTFPASAASFFRFLPINGAYRIPPSLSSFAQEISWEQVLYVLMEPCVSDLASRKSILTRRSSWASCAGFDGKGFALIFEKIAVHAFIIPLSAPESGPGERRSKTRPAPGFNLSIFRRFENLVETRCLREDDQAVDDQRQHREDVGLE